MNLRRQPTSTMDWRHHCQLITPIPDLNPDRMNRRIFPILSPHLKNSIMHLGNGNLMLGFDPFTRSFLIDSIAIIDVKSSGSAKLIIPTSRMFGSSFSRTQRRTPPTLFGYFFRSSHPCIPPTQSHLIRPLALWLKVI